MKRISVLFQENILRFSSSLRSNLEKKEYEAIYFSKAADAIDILNKKDISLIVINDIETLKEIKQFYNDNTTSIIVVLNDTSMIGYYLKEGATDFINLSVIDEDIIPRIDISLKKCQQMRNLIDMTNKDFLTNLYNRRYFYENAYEIYEKESDIAICMIDIDDFKAINDTYGHLAGDLVIKELAKVLDKNIKGKDLAARLGGDEFVLLLQDISAKSAHDLVVKIQNIVKNKVLKIGENNINFTISIGLTSEKYSSLEEMVHFADLNLFNNKLVQKPKKKLCTNCNLCKVTKTKESAIA